MLIWIGVLLLFLAGAYYLIWEGTLRKTLLVKPRSPKLEIVETNTIGWWAYQECLSVDTFQVELVESKLNLFNNKSLIKYTVKGKISKDGNWKPFIKNIHISQRFLGQHNGELDTDLHSDTTNTPEAMIEITPVIKVTSDENYKGEAIEFEFTNELKLESFHWGDNRIRFQCANKWQDIILKQRK